MKNEKTEFESLSENEILWITIKNEKIKAPMWMHTAGIDKNKNVFIPASISGNEKMSFLCASWDGNVPAGRFKKHLFLPTWWMKKEYSKDAELIEYCKKVESIILEKVN